MNKKKKILIADDSAFMRNIIKDYLSEEGCLLLEVENGKQTLEKIESEQPDLVLLDIIMPELDGISVLQKVGKTSKVIVISAVGQEKMIVEAKRLGALDYITKPIDPMKDKEKILSVIRSFI
jgi:DNA-binding response OmpR family regulator